MYYRFRFVIFLLVVASCVNEKDYNLTSVTITPTVALPLASGNIGVIDLASDADSAYLKTYSDGLLYFSYTKTYPSREIRALFDLPTTYSSSASFDLVPGSLPPSATETDYGTVYKQVDFNFTPGQLSQMLLKGGSVHYTVSVSPATNPTLPLAVNVTMTDVVNTTTQLPLTFGTTIGSGSVSMKDYLINMDQNKFNVKLDLILKPRTSAVFVPVGTKVTITFKFDNDFSYIKGFFGDQTVQIPTQTLDLTVFNSALKNTKISFVNPVVAVAVTNEYGVPCEINFTNMVARKDATVVPFQLDPQTPIALGMPTTLGGAVTTPITVTNAAQIVTLSPNTISYGGTARINKGLSSGQNFMTDTSRLKISMITELPLYGYVSNFTFSDTLKVDLGDVSQSTVLTASMKVKALNQMPLDANIQLNLTDAKYNVTDSIFSPNQTYLVKASAVTPSGDLLSQGVNDQLIALLPATVNKIFSSSYIIVKSKFNTAKDANGAFLNVKFKSSYKLKLDIGLLAKLNIIAK